MTEDLEKILASIQVFGNLVDRFTVYEYVTSLEMTELMLLEEVMAQGTEARDEILAELAYQTKLILDPVELLIQLRLCLRHRQGVIQINTEKGMDKFRVIPFSCN